MFITRANGAVFPTTSPALVAAAPRPDSGLPDYPSQVTAFVRANVPDTFDGQPVGFLALFYRTTPAGPDPGESENLRTLRNLEIWGLPTSRPAADPGSSRFIYQRFQRGIMQYDAVCQCAQGLLIGDYFKAVITGRNLPGDLDADMRGSRFYRQYRPPSPLPE
jgi:hypothetical protein